MTVRGVFAIGIGVDERFLLMAAQKVHPIRTKRIKFGAALYLAADASDLQWLLSVSSQAAAVKLKTVSPAVTSPLSPCAAPQKQN